MGRHRDRVNEREVAAPVGRGQEIDREVEGDEGEAEMARQPLVGRGELVPEAELEQVAEPRVVVPEDAGDHRSQRDPGCADRERGAPQEGRPASGGKGGQTGRHHEDREAGARGREGRTRAEGKSQGKAGDGEPAPGPARPRRQVCAGQGADREEVPRRDRRLPDRDPPGEDQLAAGKAEGEHPAHPGSEARPREMVAHDAQPEAMRPPGRPQRSRRSSHRGQAGRGPSASGRARIA